MVILKRDTTSTSILSLSISAFLVRLHHGVEHERKEHRQDTGPEKAHSDSLTRSYLTMGKRKDLSGACKRDRSFSRRVEHGEDVDEHRHQRQVSCLVSFSGRFWRTL
jgi:hypothetical protein